MDLSEFTPNNKKYNEIQKNQLPKKVTKSPASLKKEGSKFGEAVGSFIVNDINDIKTSILLDYIVPGLKDLAVGIIDSIFNRNGEYRSTNHGSFVNNRIPYGSAYRGNSRQNHGRSMDSRMQQNYDYRELTWQNRGQAEVALNSLWNILDEYKVVSIADLFDIAQCTPPGDASGNSYGWFDLSGSEVVRTFDGRYCIKLPVAVSLK